MRLRTLILVVLSCGFITSCASSAPSSPTPPPTSATEWSPQIFGTTVSSDTPAKGPELAGTGYRVRVPVGWQDQSEKQAVGGSTFEKVAADLVTPADPPQTLLIRPAMAVPASDRNAPSLVLEKLEKVTVPAMVTGAVTDATVTGRAVVDGAPGLFVTVTQPHGRFVSVTLIHNGELTGLTFGFDSASTPEHRDQIVRSILSTWKWQH